MEDWQNRTKILIGDKVDLFARLHVLVAGVGGVGGYVVEALARAGIGKLTIIDHDIVSVSNCNRQLIALSSTLGSIKVDAMKQRIYDINPKCQVITLPIAIGENAKEILEEQQPDIVVDAIDSVKCKIALLQAAIEREIPVYSSMGAGKRLDATAVKVMDVMDTQGCGLARAVRQGLRKLGIGRGIRCVVSTELPISVAQDGLTSDQFPNGTISYMPAVFGILLAGEVLRDQVQG